MIQDLNYEGYIGFSSDSFGDRINDIDLSRVLIQNTKKERYTQAKSSAEYEIDFREKERAEAVRHSRDIIRDHHVQEMEEIEQSHMLINVLEDDNEEQVLLKFYETQKNININMRELIKTLKLYKADSDVYLSDVVHDDQFQYI